MEYQQVIFSATEDYEQLLTEQQRRNVQNAMQNRKYEQGYGIELNELLGAERNMIPHGLASGMLAIDMVGEDGKRLSLMVLEPKRLLWWLSFASRSPVMYSIELRFVRPSVVRLLPRSVLYQTVKENPDVMQLFLQEQGTAVGVLFDVIHDIAFLNLEERLYSRLKSYERMLESECLKFTHEALSQEFGVTREAISRALGRLAKQGRVQITRGRIKLTNGLRKYGSKRGGEL